MKSEQEGRTERCQGNRMPKARFKNNQLNIVINFSLACNYLLSRKQGCRNGEGTPIPARRLLDEVSFFFFARLLPEFKPVLLNIYIFIDMVHLP